VSSPKNKNFEPKAHRLETSKNLIQAEGPTACERRRRSPPLLDSATFQTAQASLGRVGYKQAGKQK